MLSASFRRGSLIDAFLPASPAAATRRRIPAGIALGGSLLIVVASLWVNAMLPLNGTNPVHPPVVVFVELVCAGVVLAAASWGAEGGALRTTFLIMTGTALLAASAHVAFYLPGNPVPVTGQTFAVLLVGAALGWRRGLAAATVYTLVGAAGVPVFAVAGSPVTYGYIAGFAVAAALVGWLAEHGADRRVATSILAMLAGEVAIYACGLLWLGHFTGWPAAITFGFAPFIAGDIVKLLLAALALPGAWLITGRARGWERQA